MSFDSYANGTGGSFLKASDLKNGLRGSIVGEPTIEKKDFNDGEGEKQVANLPMVLEGSDEERIWSPGHNAAAVLRDALGSLPDRWRFPIPGHFEAMNVKTQAGTRLAWCFVPDGTSGGAEQQVPNSPGPSARPSRPTTTGPRTSGATAGSKLPEFVCSYTAKAGAHMGELCGRVYTDAGEFQKHVNGHR